MSCCGCFYMRLRVKTFTGLFVSFLFPVQVDKGTVPPTSTVRKFLALLEQSDIDFNEELGK